MSCIMWQTISLCHCWSEQSY